LLRSNVVAMAITSPKATMARCPSVPESPVLAIAFLLHTFNAVCAEDDTMAKPNPLVSKTGESQDAMAIPVAIGTRDNRVGMLGKALAPSKKKVRMTVKMGMAHFVV